MTVTSPYKGLAPFQDSELDALYFFGRERDTEIVVANLIASRLTVLYGPSGVGKSSLLLASVARALRELPEAPLVVVFSSWSDDPERGLADAVATAAEVEPGRLLDVVGAALVERDVYVILDQAEEYFTYHDDGGDFESVLAELVNGPQRVNVLVSLREDSLARLDRLKARIPTLFGNVLGLDRLDRAAGRAAIVRPLERWNELEGESVDVEDALVERVLDGVGAFRVELGAGGLGTSSSNGGAHGIEAPYLQLVMQRLWEVERASGSSSLRLSALERLGGPRRIVAEHLDGQMRLLERDEQALAASVFGHLVTPSGAKIAQAPHDLADYAAVPEARLVPVLEALATNRILRRDEQGRYEIFHDVLAAEVLEWRRDHQTKLTLERERRAARRRQRRLGLLAAAALVGIALTTGLALWALSERRRAEDQASVARAAQGVADRQAAVARRARAQAVKDASAAVRAERAAAREASAARRAERRAELARDEAEAARMVAEASGRAASDAERRALDQAAVAQTERDRANVQARAADRARNRASVQAAAAQRAREASRRTATQAVRAQRRAERAATAAAGRERLAVAEALVARDPEGGMQAALDALGLDPTAPAEQVLREGLMRSRVLDVMPGGGGELVAALAGAGPTSGDAVVTVTKGGLVRVFERSQSSIHRTISTRATANCAALSPDGLTIAVGSPDGNVRLYSVATGALARTIEHVGPVLSVDFSPEGTLLVSGGTNETAKVWNVETGALVHRLAHPRAVRTVTFSPDGARIATLSSDRLVRLYDVVTGRVVVRLDQGDVPTDAAFSPDGRRIVTTGEGEVARVWDTDTGRLVSLLEGHTGNVLAAGFAPSGDRVATGSTDGTARIWDPETGRLEAQLIGHTSFVDELSYSPDGRRVLTASRDGTARLWNALSGASQAQFLGHSGRVTGVAFGGGGRWAVTTSDDGTSRAWSVAADPELLQIAAGASPIAAVAASGAFVADARRDGSVTVRSENGKPLVSVRLAASATDVALSDDSTRLLATGEDGTLVVWSLPKGVEVARFDHGGPVEAGVFMPDGRRALTAGRDGVVRAWDLVDKSGRVVTREPGPVAGLAVSSDGELLATAVGSVARIRLLDGGPPRILAGHRDDVMSVAFDASAKKLVTASVDKDVIVWDVAKGERARSYVGHVAAVRGAAFSADGRWVATAGPTRAGLWEVGESPLVDGRLAFLVGHRGPINAVAFGPRNWRVYSGGADGTLRRYDCRLCAGIDKLRVRAAAKLERLAAAARR